MLTFLIPKFPILGMIALIQFAVNLLPMYPMDGGRVLYQTLKLKYPEERCDLVSGIAGKVCMIIIVLICIYLVSLRFMGLLPILFAVFFCTAKRNIPCKHAVKRVQ